MTVVTDSSTVGANNAGLQYAEKKQKKATKLNNYLPQLFLAIGQILAHTATLVLTVILVVKWFRDDDNADLKYPAAIIVIAYAWKGVSQCIINAFSVGLIAIPLGILDILQVKEYLLFITYLKHWPKHHKESIPWKRCWYLPHQPFVSVLATFPSLVLQAFVMINTPNNAEVGGLEIATFICGVIYLFLDFISIFNYLTLSPRFYPVVIFLSFFSQGLRIVAISFLIYVIKAYTLIYWLVSYAIGLLIVIFFGFHRARTHNRDDPLQLDLLKAIYTHQTALQLTFSAVPWSPQHSVFEWWYSYIVSEIKMVVEFCCALFLIILLYKDDRDVAFYVIYGMGMLGVVVHVALLFFTNMGVSRSLRRRSLFSTTKIVSFFVFFGNALQEQYLGKQRNATSDQNTNGGKKLDDDMTRTSAAQEQQYNAHMQKQGGVELMTSSNNLHIDRAGMGLVTEPDAPQLDY